jgi:uncharacterized protein (DUF885 family)
MTEIILEVYEAFKAGGTPEMEAKAAAAAMYERLNGVKAHVDIVSNTARNAAKDDIKELATVMREGFAVAERNTQKLREEMREGFARADARMDEGFVRANARMDEGFTRINFQMDERFSKVDTRIDNVVDRMDKKMDGMKSDISSLKTNYELLKWGMGVIITLNIGILLKLITM